MKDRLRKLLGIGALEDRIAALEKERDAQLEMITAIKKEAEQAKVEIRQRRALRAPWAQQRRFLEETDGGRRKA